MNNYDQRPTELTFYMTFLIVAMIVSVAVCILLRPAFMTSEQWTFLCGSSVGSSGMALLIEILGPGRDSRWRK